MLSSGEIRKIFRKVPMPTKITMKLLASITALVFFITACSSPRTPTPPPPPTSEPEAAVLPTAESTHELYAGYTENPSLPYVIIHRSGESITALQDMDKSNFSGLVWTSASGQSITIYADSTGLPTSAVIGDEIILYSNFTDDAVDLTIIHPDGSQRVAAGSSEHRSAQ